MNDTRVSMELDTDCAQRPRQSTNWCGKRRVFSLALRIPEYAENFELLVDGARTSRKLKRAFYI